LNAGRGWLLLRGGGALWGVENSAVESLARGNAGFRISLGGRTLHADEVLGVVPDLTVRPVARVLRRFWPEPAGGMAVHAEEPLVIVDPRMPPRALVEGEAEDGQGRD
jgi:hypothetical protein